MWLNNSRIFISYSQIDRHSAHAIRDVFTEFGSNVWIDYEHLNLRGCLRSQISRAVRECSLFVIVLTPAALASNWVRFELQQACTLRKRMLVIQLQRRCPKRLGLDFELSANCGPVYWAYRGSKRTTYLEQYKELVGLVKLTKISPQRTAEPHDASETSFQKARHRSKKTATWGC
jgi:hypothetical protein